MKYVVVLKGYNVTLQRITFTFQEDSPYFLWLKVLPAAARPVLPVREADSSGARGTSGRLVTWSISVGVGTSDSAESPVAALGVLPRAAHFSASSGFPTSPLLPLPVIVSLLA